MALEKEIQLAICEYLTLKRHFFWRQNVIPPFDKKTGFYRPMSKYSMTGIPDIILVKNGQFWGLEVKTAKTTQSDNQREFEKKVTQAGGKYYVVRDVKDVQDIGL
jgi:hypothetical protein